MKKNVKYIIGALFGGAVLMFVLFFVLGNKKKEYTIIFDSSGGSSIESQIVVEGNTIQKPTDPTKEKYVFVRWEYENFEYDFTKAVNSDMTLKAIWEEEKEEENYYDVEFVVDGVVKKVSLSKITEKDLEELGFEQKDGYEIKWYVDDVEYDFSEPLTSDMKLVGKYVKITTFTVKFNSDGGTSVDSQKVKLNEKATEPEAITKYGYIFEGWYLNNNKYDFSSLVTANITLKAKWSEDSNVKRYEVTFDSDGGSKVDKQRVIENEKAKEPKAPTKSGHKFLGWYVKDKKYDFKTKVTSNITLKASWEKIVQYTVTFDKDNGSANETKTVDSGSKVTKPANPSKTGHTFVGWTYDNKIFDFNTPITANITLKAKYEELAKYTVTFDSKGGTDVSAQQVYVGSTAKRPSNPTKSNHEFVGWKLDGSTYDFNTKVTKDITLVAEWRQVSHTYKVEARKADSLASVDSTLTVYQDNQRISFASIKNRGYTLCSGDKPVVNTGDLKGLSTLTVVLTDGSEVTATLVRIEN